MAEYNPSKIIKDGNTYNFRDTTKIPLSGSNQISGDLIPATDNSIDIGSSTNNIKMLYTKRITINGTQFFPSAYIPRSGGRVLSGSQFQQVSNKNHLEITGGTDYNSGPSLVLTPYDSVEGWQPQGSFILHTSNCDLIGKPDGTLLWNGKNIDCVEEQINAPNGYIRYTNGIQICWGGFMNNNNIGPGASSYTFPKAFNAEPRIIVTANLLELYLVTATANATTFSVGFIQCYQMPVTYTQNNVVFDYIAIGTWK